MELTPEEDVKYVFASTLPSAFRNWFAVPPDLLKPLAINTPVEGSKLKVDVAFTFDVYPSSNHGR